MKYIIEIEDEPFGRNDDPVIPHGMDELYRAKEFNTLVFDKYGLDKLTPLDKELDEAYQRGLDEGKKAFDLLDAERDSEYRRGLNDAWETARKIVCDEGFSVNELYKIFRKGSSDEILRDFTATEALERIKAYEKEKQKANEIKVGDEVSIYGINGNIVVVEVDGDCVDISDLRGWHSWYDRKYVKKTGRHFPQVAELLKAMKGEQRYCSSCEYSSDPSGIRCRYWWEE